MGIMAMELACSRNCAVSAWESSSKMGASLTSRHRRLAPRSVFPPVRAAAEEVGTEQKSEAEEKGKITATYLPPPTKKKWTGYVEKDTAGQTNIYAVEPTVYVAENVFSSGKAGKSAEGSSANLAIVVGFSLIALAGAASILLTVGKSAPVTSKVATGYTGPPLSYYIAKFSPEGPIEESLSVAPDPALGTAEPTTPAEEAKSVEQATG